MNKLSQKFGTPILVNETMNKLSQKFGTPILADETMKRLAVIYSREIEYLRVGREINNRENK